MFDEWHLGHFPSLIQRASGFIILSESGSLNASGLYSRRNTSFAAFVGV